MPAGSMWHPPGLCAGPLCLHHNFVTLFTDSASVFNPLFFFFFLKNVVLIPHRRWYSCVLTGIKEEQTHFFWQRRNVQMEAEAMGLAGAPRGPDSLAPFLHLNIFKRTSDLKPG